MINININVSKETTKDQEPTSDIYRELGFPQHTIEKAIENAVKNREFEIQMYWKRATYFWVFVSALWIAFGILLKDWGFLKYPLENNPRQFATLFILSCAGIGLSFAWYMVNKGSKFWQENWEFQINFLEDEIIGLSYKTVLSERTIGKRNFFPPKPLDSFPFSVSKINVIIALSNIVLWLISANIWFLLLFFHEHIAVVISRLYSVLKSLTGSSPICLCIVFFVGINAIVFLALFLFSKIGRSGFEEGKNLNTLYPGKIEHFRRW